MCLNKRIVALLLTVLVVSLFTVHFYTGLKNSKDEGGHAFNLVEPAFAQDDEAFFLRDEAGISLYLDAHRLIDPNAAKMPEVMIEKETAEYFIGSIHLPDLSEDEDVHCFVHTVGWLVTYYLRDTPVSKLIDWNQWSESESRLTTNKLEEGLEKIAHAVGIEITGAKYYHFQYPNATKIMIIIETQESAEGDSFNLKIPNELEVYERSWAHYVEYLYYSTRVSNFNIGPTTINSIIGDSSAPYDHMEYGNLTNYQLSQGLFHNISISGYWRSDVLFGVGIALVYEEL